MTDFTGSVLKTEKDSYRIGQKVGSGGIGVVHKATQCSDGLKVGVKFLHSDRFALTDAVYARFKREAELGRAPQHPNLMRALDAGNRSTSQECDFIVMEFLEGGLLSRRIGSLTESERLEISIGLCEGLRALHELGLVHRDLKTNNVILVAGRGPVICDYGLLKPIAPDIHLTDSTDKLGSLLYVSQRQLRHPEGADEHDDLYALMACLFEVYGGERMSIRWNKNPLAHAPVGLRSAIQNILLERWERHEWPSIPEVLELVRADVDEEAASALLIAHNIPTNVDMFVAWHVVCVRIREIVLDDGGGWAGCSMADIDTYLELCRDNDLVPKVLLGDIDELRAAIGAGVGGQDVHRGEAEDAWKDARSILARLELVPNKPS